MKTSIILFLTTVPVQAITVSWSDFLHAIAYQESRNGRNMVSALSRRENSVGIYQLRPTYVADANRISGRHYTLADRLSKQKSEAMMAIVISHYIKAYHLRWTVSNAARIHNGGTNGWRKKSTLKYAREVREYILRNTKNNGH